MQVEVAPIARLRIILMSILLAAAVLIHPALAGDATSFAASKIGCRYVYGAVGPTTFDCSGLTKWAYAQVGIVLPRTSAQQASFGSAVDRTQLTRGDLVFFDTVDDRSTRVEHVGIFEGGSVFIDANSVSGRVQRDDLNNSYWKAHYLFARRVNSTTTTLVPLYRYMNDALSDHFYTTSWSELQSGAYGYRYERVECYVISASTPGTTPLYRYVNDAVGDHLYTTNWSELGSGSYGYRYEKIECYVFSTQAAGTTPLYRYVNDALGDHFYTRDWAELGTGNFGYRYEGIQCYVKL